MKIPNKIKIGAHSLPVDLVHASEIESEGTYDSRFRMIRLRNDLDKREDSVSEAFLHEIFEAIRHFYQLDLQHKDLTVFCEVLFTVIRDNNLDFR